MICSAGQIDSFWKTFVLSKLWESSMRAMVSEPPFFGASLVAGVPPVLLEPELLSLLEPPPAATTAAAATASSVVAGWTRMPPPQATTGADVAHCVKHTGSDVPPGRPLVGSRRTG